MTSRHADTTARMPKHRASLAAAVAAHPGSVHQILTEVAQLVGASIAYVDRDTIEAHLDRRLADQDWKSIVARHLPPMGLDEQVGDAGTLRTDWIETILADAGVPGADYTALLAWDAA